MLKWEDRYKIGEERIDSQHKFLFGLINNFEVALEDGQGRLYCEDCFHFLHYYAKVHFGNEETCMNRHKCPFAEKNKIAHQKFMATLDGFKDKLEVNGHSEELMVEMHHFLEQWITNHIIGVDLHLKDSIKANLE